MLQHPGLRQLVGADGSDAAAGGGGGGGGGGKRRGGGVIDEGVQVYLQMLQPRAKSPPRFPD